MPDIFSQLTTRYDSLKEELPQLDKNSTSAKARKLLDEIREAGMSVLDPEQRNILSNLARDLGEIIFEVEGVYPSVRLASAEQNIQSTSIIAEGNVTTVAGDIDVAIQIVQQTTGQMPRTYNLLAQLNALQQALPKLTHPAEKAAIQASVNQLQQIIASLPQYEQHYRERIRARYAEDIPYYIPLTGETSEIISKQIDSHKPRSTRRRHQRALAEYHEWIQAGQEIKRVKLNTLRQAVDKYPCIILLGDPGSGKTTALEYLAYEFAGEPDRLPIPLNLSEFGPGMSVEEFIIQGWGGSLEANHWSSPELAANLEGYLEEGRLLLLFDALNEMPREGYRERTLALRRFIERWMMNNRFLVTCRVLDYGEELSGLQRVEIQPLNDAQVQALLQKELPEDWERLWQVLAGSRDPHRQLLIMARNPYLLTMIIDIFSEDGQLGRNRAHLIARFTQILMEWAKGKCPPNQWLEADVQREALSVMAFEMQKRAGSGAMVETAKIKTIMPDKVQPDPNWPPHSTPPDQVLSLAASANLIEMPGDRSLVRFYHQLLQEYFAARQLLKQDLASLEELWRWPWLEEEMPLWVRPEDNTEPLPPPPPTGWEETTILAAGLVPENDNQLVQALIQVNPILAGRCLHEGQIHVDKSTRKAVIMALLKAISQPEIALRVRIAAAEILGYLGDSRLGELIAISAGRFLIGDDDAVNTNKLQLKINLSEYHINRFPLTNAEFAAFIEAGGYYEPRWWSEAGWAQKEQAGWTEPRYWKDEVWNKPNQPVVGISWYECIAVCHWLSAETGKPYRLPTELEWEKAARGTDGRKYPWGNEFESTRVNAKEGVQVVNATTPVGIYPTGSSPYGLQDCAGNVWEWCVTRWSQESADNTAKDEWSTAYLQGTEHRVIRGGSWSSLKSDVLCYIRRQNKPDTRENNIGVRLAVSI